MSSNNTTKRSRASSQSNHLANGSSNMHQPKSNGKRNNGAGSRTRRLEKQDSDMNDPNLKVMRLHQELLGVILNHASANNPIDRMDLEKIAIKHTLTSIKRCSESRKSEVVRSCINVLLGLHVLEETDDLALTVNYDQARVLENTDHYSYGYFSLKDLETKLAREEESLLVELEARSKNSKNGNRSSKRLKETQSAAVSETETTKPSVNAESEYVVLAQPILDKVKSAAAVERVRALQMIMHTAGSRTMIERAAGNNQRFNPAALGPVGATEMPYRAKESKGPCGGMRPLGSAIIDESNDANETTRARDAEVEIKTRPLDFCEDIALQFEVWNGQDSELGISGRASPRPTASPGPDNLNNPTPSPGPSLGAPVLNGNHVANQVVRVPQWQKLEVKALTSVPSLTTLTEEEREEERMLGDEEMLAKHDAALEAFKVKYEKEQDAANKKRKEQKEAAEKHTREIIAKARQRSASSTSAIASNSHNLPAAPKHNPK